ncbi:MAG: hypothetical protein M3522_12190 [Actinomycetota bacterium]|nr:hypothetical protein [Actinomycetota bacterium]
MTVGEFGEGLRGAARPRETVGGREAGVEVLRPRPQHLVLRVGLPTAPVT